MTHAARFSGKVALITGAANGIARETARIMAAEGASIAAFDRDEAGLSRLEKELRFAGGGRLLTRAIDVLDEASVDRAVADAAEAFGGIDILVNGVGGSTAISRPDARIEDLSLAEWETLVAFNMRPTFLVSRAVVRIMKPRRAGKIVNMSSLSATGGGGLSTAYSAAKGGVTSLTRKLAMELGPFGITCNEIAPNRTLTERVKEKFAFETDEERARLLAGIPLGRFATAEDQARVVCFLASRDADFITGATLDVTGGQRQ